MRVLIIRPEIQARKTADKLAELGHEPVVFPLFRPSHDVEKCFAALSSPHSALAITSAEAVRCLQDLGPRLEPFLSGPLFTVGESTARYAQKAGFTNIMSARGNGKHLAALVAGHFASASGQDDPILYLAGARRSSLFEDTLTQNDIDLAITEIYDMEPIPYTLEQQQRLLVYKHVDAVFLFSRENANAFFSLDVFQDSKEALRKTLFFCLSRNIADAVPDDLKNSAVISLNPDEDELIDLL